MKKYRDVIGGSVFFLFAATYFVMAFGIKQFSDGFISSDFIPKVYGIILMVLSALQVVFAVIANRRSQTTLTQEEGGLTLGQTLISVTLTFALLLGYVGLLRVVGFIIMSSVFIFLMTLMLYPKDQRTARRLLFVAAVAILFSVSVYLLFVKAFALSLPAGILG